jgi:hypothetical protein
MLKKLIQRRLPPLLAGLLVCASSTRSRAETSNTNSHIAVPQTSVTALADQKPLVDAFGQWIDGKWPGKVKSLEQLEKNWSAEALSFSENEFGWSLYGGFTNQQLKATGFFRTEQVGGRWWIVCPDGHPFFSTGINGISAWAGSPVDEREALFAQLPPTNSGALLRRPGRPGEVSFHTWNLVRRFDTVWRGIWLDATVARMESWGFNTIGNASDARLFDMHRKPYVVALRGINMDNAVLGLPDVFADGFESGLQTIAEEQCAPRKDDPWMLGYFLAGETQWPGRELDIAEGFVNGPDCATRRELKKALAAGDSPERRRAFVHSAMERFISASIAAIRKHDTNHLILGLRFNSLPSEEILKACRAFDVFSMNSREYEPNHDAISRANEITGKPVLITEFQFGVAGRGMGAGLKPVANHKERGTAYRHFVENAAANPAVVGTHWTQFVDQPATGRMDGGNNNIGLVDVTDRPYEPLTEAARATHRRLYQVHSGATKPFSQKAKVN